MVEQACICYLLSSFVNPNRARCAAPDTTAHNAVGRRDVSEALTAASASPVPSFWGKGRLERRKDVSKRLSIIICTGALVVACLGVTPLGQAAGKAVAVAYAKVAGSANN